MSLDHFLLYQNEQNNWICNHLYLRPYLHQCKQVLHVVVFQIPCVKNLFLCLEWYKKISELRSHHLQNNITHIFNSYSD